MLSIISEPQEVGLAKNPLAVKLQTDNYIVTPGQKAVGQFKITGDTSVGDTINLVWDGNDITFTFCSSATPLDNSGLQIFTNDFGDYIDDYAISVVNFLRSKYEVDSNFSVSIISGSATEATILFVALESGTKYDLAVTTSGVNLTNLSSIAGVDDVVRENFKVLFFLYVERIFNSNSFLKIVELEGAVDSGNYCVIEFDDPLFSEISSNPPTFEQSVILSAENILRRYYYTFAESYNVPAEIKYIANQGSAPKNVILAGYSFDKFPGNDFLASYINHATARKFLTMQPRSKYISATQQEFLYLYNTQAAGTLNLVAKIYYTDGTTAEQTMLSATALKKQVYIFPAGYTQLAIADVNADKTVKYYEIYVSHSTAGTQSEKFTYYVNFNLYRDNFYLLFLNSLGGFDTVWCNGIIERKSSFDREIFSGIVPPDYAISNAETINYNISYQHKITIDTGYKDKEYIDYLHDLLNSSEVYIISDTGFIRVNIDVKDEDFGSTDDSQHSLSIAIIPSYKNRSYTC